jgi:hypothetical protein
LQEAAVQELEDLHIGVAAAAAVPKAALISSTAASSAAAAAAPEAALISSTAASSAAAAANPIGHVLIITKREACVDQGWL